MSSDNEYMKSVDGVIYSKDGDTLIMSPKNKTSFEIPEGVKVIDSYAFSCNNKLSRIIIPSTVISFCGDKGDMAFGKCPNLISVTCKAILPPVNSTDGIFSNYNGYLYVPCESFENYDTDEEWGNFKHIQCIKEDATATPGGVTITKGTNSAVFTCPKSDNAVAYTLQVLKDGVEVCSLEFNAQGQVTGIVLRSTEGTEGFKFKVGGQYIGEKANNSPAGTYTINGEKKVIVKD